MTDIAEIGVAFDTRQIKDGIRDFDRLNTTGEETGRVMKDLNRNMGQLSNTTISAGRGMNRFGVVTQQLGYQVGDFVVQVQSGTNAFVAFGQQATQLAGLLYLIPGAMGAVVGTAASILIPSLTAVLAYFSRTGESSNSFGNALNSLKDDISSTALEIERLNRGLETTNEVLIENEITRLEAQLAARIAAREDPYTDTMVQDARIKAIEDEIAANEELLRQIRELREQRKAIEDRKIGQERLAELQQEIVLLTMVQKFGSESLQVKQQIAAQEKLAFEEMLKGLNISDDLKASLRSAYDATVLLRKETEAYEKSIAASANSATILASNLGISFENAKKLLAGGNAPAQAVVLDPRDPRYNAERARMQLLEEERARLRAEFSKPLPGETQDGRASKLRQEIGLTNELTEAERQRLDLIQSVESSLESGFMAMIDGTKSVKDAFRSMARDIIAELYRVYVVKQIVSGISNVMFPSSLAPSSVPVPTPRPFASGGSIMPGGTYLVGEKGPEIITPRHSGTVVPAHLSGQGGQSSMTVNNNITVTGSDAANVRMEVAKMIPQITEATKAAVIDARRRGGQMRAAFV